MGIIDSIGGPPAARIFAVVQIAVGGGDSGGAGAHSCFDVPEMITNKDGRLWSNSQFPQCKQDGFRVWFGVGDMIRANNGAWRGC